MLLNVVIPQVLWFRRVRTNPVLLFLVAFSINVGMWVERFVIVITSLHRDFTPSAWGMFYPDGLGLGDAVRQHGAVPYAAVPLHPLPADDLDFRNARIGRRTGESRRMKTGTSIYGLVAEFETHEQLLEAATKARERGYRRMDGYTPFPVEGLPEALGRKRTLVPLVVLLGGIFGGIGRLLHGMVCERGQLPAEHRRTAA